jgi:pimeloyl-ACP methyl ester carboxylesterase
VATDVIRKTTIGRWNVQVYQHLIDALKQKGGYVEYQVNNNPSRQTSAGCDLSQRANKPNLFIFAYDWRQSNAATASALRDYVGCVQQFYPDRQINILTHSMGGLVARRYILDNPRSHNVKKLVTIAAPWLGAPKALYFLETGNFFNIYLADSIYAPIFKSLVEFFPSVHQILPSRTYYSLAGSPFGERPGKLTWDVNQSGTVEENYQAVDVVKLLDTMQFKSSTPARTGNEFHDNAGEDDWHNDSSGVQYYHIYGVQYWNQTVGKVIAEKHLQFDWQGNTVEKNRYNFTPVPGDGTVPSVSAKRAPSLNAPNATFKNFGPSYLGPNDASDEHVALTQNEAVIDYVLSCLSNDQSARLLEVKSKRIAGFERTHHVRKRSAPQEENPVFGNIYDVKLDGVTLPTIRDAFGNDTSQIADLPFGNVMPNVSNYVSGEDSYQLLLPADIPPGASYTMSFTGTGQPLTIDFDKSQGELDTATQLVRYLDINLAAGTPLQLTFDSNGPQNLVADEDGDGVFETIIAPTASVTGDAARDRVEPVISFTEAIQNGQHLVQVQGSDPSGVRTIRYSLDGVKFQIYEQAIALNTCVSRTVYAVADDNVGNRSGVAQYDVANVPPDVSSARASVETLWPPNHKMVQIQIWGVQDQDCDPVSIVITGITQDELVDASGDGNTCPDAQVIGNSSALLRAERNGAGNGRVYTVKFTATDARGGQSFGSVKVRVPRNANTLAIEDLTKFDSTSCP